MICIGGLATPLGPCDLGARSFVCTLGDIAAYVFAEGRSPGRSAGTKFSDFCCHVEVSDDREAGIVRAAELEIGDAEFGKRLKDIGVWLGTNGFAPSAFTYFFLSPGIRLRIAFIIDDEAAAFAARFGGIVVDAARPCHAEAESRGARPSARRTIETEPVRQ
jgi:hypothetical protein